MRTDRPGPEGSGTAPGKGGLSTSLVSRVRLGSSRVRHAMMACGACALARPSRPSPPAHFLAVRSGSYRPLRFGVRWFLSTGRPVAPGPTHVRGRRNRAVLPDAGCVVAVARSCAACACLRAHRFGCLHAPGDVGKPDRSAPAGWSYRMPTSCGLQRAATGRWMGLGEVSGGCADQRSSRCAVPTEELSSWLADVSVNQWPRKQHIAVSCLRSRVPRRGGRVREGTVVCAALQPKLKASSPTFEVRRSCLSPSRPRRPVDKNLRGLLISLMPPVEVAVGLQDPHRPWCPHPPCDPRWSVEHPLVADAAVPSRRPPVACTSRPPA